MFEQCLHRDISTLEELELVFNNAKRMNLEVGVYITVPGCDREEVIVNPPENLDVKLDYYKRAYNDDLTLKNFNKIRITKAMLPLVDEDVFLQ